MIPEVNAGKIIWWLTIGLLNLMIAYPIRIIVPVTKIPVKWAKTYGNASDGAPVNYNSNAWYSKDIIEMKF